MYNTWNLRNLWSWSLTTHRSTSSLVAVNCTCVMSICRQNTRYSYLTCSPNKPQKQRNHVIMKYCHSWRHPPRWRLALNWKLFHLRHNRWQNNPPEGAPSCDAKTLTLYTPAECAMYAAPNCCTNYMPVLNLHASHRSAAVSDRVLGPRWPHASSHPCLPLNTLPPWPHIIARLTTLCYTTKCLNTKHHALLGIPINGTYSIKESNNRNSSVRDVPLVKQHRYSVVNK